MKVDGRIHPFEHWEKTKDLVDQLVDILVNYRQSGHPGGSRSVLTGITISLPPTWCGYTPTPRTGSLRWRRGPRAMTC